MTQDEAKTKVCPFMSNAFAADTPDLRNGDLIKVYCIGVDCMAWEWEKLGSIPNEQLISDTDGYCKRLEK